MTTFAPVEAEKTTSVLSYKGERTRYMAIVDAYHGVHSECNTCMKAPLRAAYPIAKAEMTAV